MKQEINLLEIELEAAQTEQELESVTPTQHTIDYTQGLLPGMVEKIKSVEEKGQQLKKTNNLIKRVIEALLFSSNEALSFDKIREITDTIEVLKPRNLRNLISDLQQDYLTQQRAFRLEETAQGFILRSCEELSTYIDLLYRNKRTEKLSHAAAEVLAIIAYRQPITKPQIEVLRGVDCSGVVYSLLERELIEPVGKLEAPGRPTLYGITKSFLSHFGLRDLNDLPQMN